MTSGRKRAFDEAAALQAAMDVFWQKGYAGASLTDLTQHMGINKPSLYSTFGNKEELFVKATNFYIENKAKSHLKFLIEPGISLKIRVKNYMMSVVAGQCESETPKGCYIFLCQSEVVSGDIPEEASRLLRAAGDSIQTVLETLFKDDPQAQALGLNDGAKRRALCLATTLRGTASMARAREPLSELEHVIDHSLKGVGLQ